MKAKSWKMRIAGAGLAVLFGGAAAVTIPPGGTVGAAGSAAKVGRTVPAAAMKTTIGVTSNTVTIGTIAWSDIFGGAKIGTEAYADYVNSKGGVNGRKIVVTWQSTNYSGTTDAQLTESAIRKDLRWSVASRLSPHRPARS